MRWLFLMMACAAPASAPVLSSLPAGWCRKNLSIDLMVQGDKCRYAALKAPQGYVDYVCEGGEAEGHFGEVIYRGAFDKGELQIKVSEAAKESSTCTRDGVSRISGKFGALRFHFNDSNPNCNTKCTAHGSVIDN